MIRLYILIFLIAFQFLGCKTGEKKDKVKSVKNKLEMVTSNILNFEEPSGVCYNRITNRLLIVSDGNSTIYETDLQGNVIAKTIIEDVDLEGIALSKNCDTLYVVNEAYQLVSKYYKDGSKMNTFPVRVATNKDHSLEGITMDENNNLVVINEKLPILMMKFEGTKEVFRKELKFIKDCADITYDSELDCYWIISDESKSVAKISKQGDLLEEYSIPFKKGEGIAVVNDKIYVVNDNEAKLYIFKKPLSN